MDLGVVIIVEIEAVDHHAQAQGHVRARPPESLQPQCRFPLAPLFFDEPVDHPRPGLRGAVHGAAHGIQQTDLEANDKVLIQTVEPKP